MQNPETAERSRSFARYLAALFLLAALLLTLLLGAHPAMTLATTAAAGEYPETAVMPELANDAITTAPPAVTAAKAVDGPPATVAPISAAAVPAATDTTPPAVSALTPADGAFTGPTPLMGYSFSDPSGALWPDGVHLYIDNRCSRTFAGPTNITAASLTFTPSLPLAEGPHRLEAFLCDNAFNCGSTYWNITVDASAPLVTETSPGGTINTRNTIIHAAYNDGSGAGIDTGAVSVTLDGNPITGSCSISAAGLDCAAGTLGDGNHEVTVVIPDLIGLAATRSWTFAVDTSAISISGQAPLDGSWQNNSRPMIGATFQPAATGVVDPNQVTVELDSADVTPGATVTSQGFDYTPAVNLAEGNHTARVTVADNDGHSGASQWSFNIDTAAPQLLGKAPTGTATGRAPAITAAYADTLSGVDPATVRLLLDSQDVTSAASHDAATISFIPPHDLAAGNHTVQLSLEDYAGNLRTATWSFNITAIAGNNGPNAAAPPASASASAAGTTSFSYYSTLSSGGRWTLTGITAQPNIYYIPWYETTAATGQKAEIVIENQGAGEAFVNAFLAGDESWTGKIPEGEKVSLALPGDKGPLKIICPTGQALAASLVLSGDSWQTSMAALNGDDLAATWLLPWYGGGEAGASNTIAVANAGIQTAEVEIYIGDSLLPESLRGRLTIAPETTALADFPGVSGGPVKVVATNGQPLAVGQVSRYRDSVSLASAATFRQLDTSYSLDGNLFNDVDQLWLMVGNPGGDTVDLSITAGGAAVTDPEQPGSDTITLGPEQSRLIPLERFNGDGIEVNCDGCGFGRGVLVGWRAISGDSYVEALAPPRQSSSWPQAVR